MVILNEYVDMPNLKKMIKIKISIHYIDKYFFVSLSHNVNKLNF